jgi:hypothetical protein
MQPPKPQHFIGPWADHAAPLKPQATHLEGLAQEALDLACTCHSQLVLFAQLIHTQDSNDILSQAAAAAAAHG